MFGKKKDKENSELNENKKSKKNKKVKKNKVAAEDLLVQDNSLPDLLSSSRRTLRNLCAPDGVNPAPLTHMEIVDGGKKAYVCNFYVEELCRAGRFAETYATLLNFPNTTSKVEIEPLPTDKALDLLTKRIRSLETEINTERKGRCDSVKISRLQRRVGECEQWIRDIDNGYASLFKARFLFSIYAESIDKLDDLCEAFYSAGKSVNIKVASTYTVHPEAYMSNAPLADMMEIGVGPFKDSFVKSHYISKLSAASLFNHTQSNFSHRNGILGGHIIDTSRPALIDPYDRSHDNYNIAASGVSGVGKSATFKMWTSRMNLVKGAKVAVIDMDSSNGQYGEYVDEINVINGVVYQIKHNSPNILNMFDINEEYEWNPSTHQEDRKLYLVEKVDDCAAIVMTMVKGGREVIDFDIDIFLNDIIGKAIMEMYADRGIEEGVPDSLYTQGEVLVNNRLVADKVKKEMPTLGELYVRLRRNQKRNKSAYHEKAFAIVIAALEVYIKDVIFSEETITILNEDDYARLPLDSDGNKVAVINGQEERVRRVRGFKPYFDGQSNVSFDITKHDGIDIDISQLPEKDRDVAQQIAASFINEHCVKKNSSNPNKIQEMVFIIDEFHRMFKYVAILKLIASLYRQARKRYVCMVTLTQALADYNVNEDTKAILKNSSMKVIFKQDKMDTKFIKETTPLTDTQIERIMSLGGGKNALGEYDDNRKGELCLIDNNLDVVFIKVDYLKQTEAVICETDAAKRAKIFAEKRKIS